MPTPASSGPVLHAVPMRAACSVGRRLAGADATYDMHPRLDGGVVLCAAWILEWALCVAHVLGHACGIGLVHVTWVPGAALVPR